MTWHTGPRKLRPLAVATALLIACLSAPAQADDCAGTPAGAITTLPEPLDAWGQLFCTPYGHVIAAHEGWIWSQMGAYAPVFIPSQMVRDNPAPLGNQSYFTSLTLAAVTAEEAEPALAEIRKLFADMPKRSYRFDAVSVSGRALRLYFLDYGNDSRLGIWCRDGTCGRESIFMLLDMSKEPGGKSTPR